MRVKVCGITNLRDAEKAVEIGADALGFNFYKKSPRFIPKISARKIIQGLPPFVTPVGIFVNESLEGIQEIVYYTGLRVVQLHGDEAPDFCAKFSRPVIKAIRVAGPQSFQDMTLYKVGAFLLDGATDTYGGSGKGFDWGLAQGSEKFGRIILSGGLTPENVREAISVVHPYAVDVCSGIEKEPGKKDHMKLKDFFENAKG